MKPEKSIQDLFIESMPRGLITDEEQLAAWQLEYKDDIDKIQKLRGEGHTHHCSCRLVWGDGCCTCRKGLEEGQE
jgi:hypothetical protein